MDALICRESGSAPFADYGCQMMPASQFIPNHSFTCHKLLKPWFWPIKNNRFCPKLIEVACLLICQRFNFCCSTFFQISSLLFNDSLCKLFEGGKWEK